jgi:hypothetical protein
VLLEPLHPQRPHPHFVLPEALLQLRAVRRPPAAIQFRLDHDLVDQDIVAHHAFAVLGPQALGGRAAVGGEAAEALDQVPVHLFEGRARKGLALGVVQRQQKLHEMHGFSLAVVRRRA